MAAQAGAQFALYDNMFPNHRFVLVRLNGQVQGMNQDPGVAGIIANWIQGGTNNRVFIEVPPQLQPPPNPPNPDGGDGG